MDTPTIPNLNTMPHEIVDMICDKLHEITEVPLWESILALRSTSQTLYVATDYQLAKMIGTREANSETSPFVFMISQPSLYLLLRLSAKPLLKKELKYIKIIHADRGLDYHPAVAGPSYCTNYRVKWASEDHLLQDYADMEHMEYERSAEAVYLLSEIFNNLKNTPSLKKIEVHDGFPAVLTALELTKFSERKVNLHISPKSLWRYHSDEYFSNLPSRLDCIRRVKIAHKYGDFHHRESVPTHPALNRLLDAVNMNDTLQIEGCQRFQIHTWKICDGCASLFYESFLFWPYRNLQTLELAYLHIDGIQLNTWLKNHSQTLTKFRADTVYLTRGSWKTIFKTLSRNHNIDHLSLAVLYQKQRDGWVKWVEMGPTSTQSRLVGKEKFEVCGTNVAPFLYDSIYFFGFLRPTEHWTRYLAVNLLEIPNISFRNPRDAHMVFGGAE
ncbi:hypothetical protein P154DRAFT_600521 [Amniculicola lignicola CBS 123094]|uniref:Uncharacterized protein n=1 Tax=Amniculicola lignicola CBS 123094 TaxID=1392246 RepID=A0A6A5WYA1_9PLEO|nr:hypothetical protein P154DRAFT_600521 [Amniculicola lignicola CBS 123094]